ncbi:MAG: response regulator transcription factor [Spirochaetales bacterium]|nr:response regulator transcription factor [Spirochaetales bacterium]
MTILLVEDDEAIRNLEKDYLEAAGFEVQTAERGPEGMEASLRPEVDLVVLDLMLPELNGFEICRRLREQREVPILIVSAKTDDFDKVRALGLGADDYLVKPFSPAEMVARVKAHLARFDRLTGKNALADVIELRGLRLNRSARRVWVDDQEVALTSKEFDVLELFVTNPSRVLSKEEIFDRVWGLTYGDVSTVTVHVRKIREKLTDTGDEPRYIKTLWGAGYRLDP